MAALVLKRYRYQLAAVFALFVFMQPAMAVNKCTTKDGKTVYQDTSCDTTTTGSQSVKTWDNTPGAYYPISRQRDIEPNERLEGPPQAATMLRIYRRWIDSEKLALSTSRIALATPVASLQTLHREAEAVDTAACLYQAKKALVALTKQSVDTVIQFMQKQELAGMVYQFVERPKLIEAFEQAITSANCKS